MYLKNIYIIFISRTKICVILEKKLNETQKENKRGIKRKFTENFVF